MTDFVFYTPETASPAAADLLNGIQRAYGFIPNLFAYMAEAPTLIEAYLMLNKLLEKTSFTPAQQQLALLAVSVENKCEFCSVAHQAFAKVKGVHPQTIAAVVNQQAIDDDSDRALVALANVMVKDRGFVDEAALSAFYQAGFTKQHVMELVLIVSIKTLSNYSNHLTQPEPNKELVAML